MHCLTIDWLHVPRKFPFHSIEVLLCHLQVGSGHLQPLTLSTCIFFQTLAWHLASYLDSTSQVAPSASALLWKAAHFSASLGAASIVSRVSTPCY